MKGLGTSERAVEAAAGVTALSRGSDNCYTATSCAETLARCINGWILAQAILWLDLVGQALGSDLGISPVSQRRPRPGRPQRTKDVVRSAASRTRTKERP